MEVYNLGYWYADFVRARAGVDVAFVPAGAVGYSPDTYDSAQIRLGQLQAWLRDRCVILASVKGTDLLQYLTTAEVSDRLHPHCPGRRPGSRDPLYYSGFQVAYDVAAQAPRLSLTSAVTYRLAVLWPFDSPHSYGRERPPAKAARKAARLAEFARRFTADTEQADGVTWRLLAADEFGGAALKRTWKALGGTGKSRNFSSGQSMAKAFSRSGAGKAGFPKRRASTASAYSRVEFVLLGGGQRQAKVVEEVSARQRQ
jgi:hypothetical protein